MADVQALIEQGKAAIKAGNKAQAKTVLTQAVDQDEGNEQAWLWLSACVDSVEEQRICLENVLAINPANEKARKGLVAISQQASKPTPPAAPPPPAKPTASAPPADDPFGGFDSNPFAGTGFDSNPYSTDPALDSQWDSFGSAPSNDSFSSTPSSVDWGRDSGVSAHGSGKDVNLPSSDEYDSWVSNLSLGGTSSSVETDFSPTSGPFNAANLDFDVPDDMSSVPPAPEPSAPITTNVSPFDDFDFNSFEGSSAFSSPFDATASTGPFSADTSNFDLDDNADPFGTGFGKTNSPVQSTMDDDPFDGAASVDTDSDPFADVGQEANRSMFSNSSTPEPTSSGAFGNSRANVFGGSIPSPQESSPGGFAFIDSNTTAPTKEAYFSAIPPEIQADGSGTPPDRRLMLTVGILAVLNVLSIAFLLVNLTKH